MSEIVNKSEGLRSRSPALYTLLMMIVFGLGALLFTGIVSVMAAAGTLPAMVVVATVHEVGKMFGIDTYQPLTSAIMLLSAAFFACYIWNRWLQPIVAVRMYVYNQNHFYPNYGSEPRNLERYLARHPNALKYPR